VGVPNGQRRRRDVPDGGGAMNKRQRKKAAKTRGVYGMTLQEICRRAYAPVMVRAAFDPVWSDALTRLAAASSAPQATAP